MSFTRTFDLLDLAQLGTRTKEFLYSKTGKTFEGWNGPRLKKGLLSTAQFLLDNGVEQGDRIILMPESAYPEWVILDLAAQRLGIVIVFVHASITVEQLQHVVKETEAKKFFYENEEIFEKLKPALTEVHCIGLYSITAKEMQEVDLEETSSAIQAEDLSTIIYTSGTTGIPKGVMLTHSNIMSNVQAICLLLPIDSSNRILSFLPYSHVFERTAVFTQLALKSQLYFIGKAQNLPECLPLIQPHFFTAVPRILERMYDQVILEFQKRKWLGKKLIAWAAKVSEKYEPHKGFNPIKFIQIIFIRHVLLGKFRKRMGGNIEAIMVGAAHLRPEIAKAFFAAGIKVREGYGMTETSPVISFNRFEPGMNRFSTVGLLLPQVQVKFRDQNEEGEGEIIVKGPNVMRGYYKNEEETKKVLDKDGWLATGDVGKMVYGRYLKITDRKKDIFKTSTGKYIAPQELERNFLQSDYIESLMVVGFQKPHVTALIFPNFELLKTWAEDQKIHWTSPQYMVLNIKVKEHFQEIIDSYNKELPNFKKIKGFHLMDTAWTIDSGQLSNTLKPIRKKILEDYSSPLKALYKNA